MDIKNEILDLCKKLKLGNGFSRNSGEIEAISHEEYLLELLKREVLHREEVRKNRYISTAGFYTLKTFDEFNFNELILPPSITREWLRSCDFINNKQNLIFYGNIGRGKTHLATAIGIEACKQGKRVLFFRTSTLVNKLSECKKAGNLSSFLKKFEKVDLLICDEWGYVPLEIQGSQLLFSIISDCYERRSVIITTNLEFSKWVSVFYDENMTAAMIDRLIHHSQILTFEGPSFRLKSSQLNN